MTKQELLEEACRCEALASVIPPGDPARRMYERDAAWFFNEALAKEIVNA